MSTPNPLVPLGTIPEKGKSHIRIAVFTILAIHVVLLGALLIAGCKKTDTAGGDAATNLPAFTPPPIEPPPLPPPSNPPPPTSVVVNPPPVTPPPVFPPPGMPPVIEQPAGFTEHTVVKGDTFASLGKKYNVGWKAIQEANPGVDSSKLKIGQKIKIPPPKPASATTPSNGGSSLTASAGGEKTYTVKSGDVLIKIAKEHGVSVKALRSANHLTTDRIRVGQKLIIPAKAAPSPEASTIPPVAPPATLPGATNP